MDFASTPGRRRNRRGSSGPVNFPVSKILFLLEHTNGTRSIGLVTSSGTIDLPSMIEHAKIILLCIVAAVVYGIVHDQITVRICREYFTVFHPPVFPTQSPSLLAFGWGVIATWWVGLVLGLLLALAARAGSRPKLTAATLLHPIARLLIVMACSAFIGGISGFLLATYGLAREPEWMLSALAPSTYPRFMADWFAHNASYASGILGGIILCVLQYRRRGHSPVATPSPV